MRSLFFGLALASLALTGCKKKAPEPAPVAAAEPAPAVAWAWGAVTFDGSRAEGNMGKLNVPFTLTNQSQTGLQFGTVAVNIFDGETKVCGGKLTVDEKASMGNSISGTVEVVCEYKTLPAGDKLSAKVTAMYTVGAEEREDRAVPVQLPFSR
jgi:hypothetical protein